MNSRIKYIDLFAGIGGFHQALNDFNTECVFASEWDVKAQSVYYRNFNLMPAGDITQIEATSIPHHDLLCAGFPCQSFSMSGKKLGFNDTRGTLFFDVVRIARFHQPKYILLENVKNLETHDNGKTLATIINSLKEINYNVVYKVLNASNFGLPQSRKRIFIVAIRQDLEQDFSFPVGCNSAIPLRDVLETKPSVKAIARNDITWLQKDVKSSDPIYKPIKLGFVGKGGQGERIYSVFGHAITLSANGGGAGAKTGLYLVGDDVRKLTPRECARIQGFPEEFVISESKTDCYKQFGNSIPVNVPKAIFKQLLCA